MPVYRFGIGFRDSRGVVYRENFFTNAPNAPTANILAYAIVGALEPLTQAHLEQGTGCLLWPIAFKVRGSSGLYSSGTNKLVLVMQDVPGACHRYRIPAIRQATYSGSVFLADGFTVDQSNPEVAAFITALTTNSACGRAGNLLLNCLGGFRSVGKQPRHLTMDMLEPNLVTQA